MVNVFAAASLAEAMSELEDRFEASHENVDVRVNLAGSNVLRRQIDDGGPVDVFVSADVKLMEGLQNLDDPGPVVFAVNQLTLVLAEQSATLGLEDLASGSVARCAEGVPCGNLTSAFLNKAEVAVGVVTEESNVRAVLTKVERGEVDAGFVYQSDARATDLIQIPLTDAPETQLGIASIGGSDLGSDFRDLVLSPESSAMFAKLGFDVTSGATKGDS